MRALATDIAHVFMSLPVYMVGLLLVLTIAAFRQGGAGSLRRWRYLLAAATIASYCASTGVVANALVGRFESRFDVPGAHQLPAHPVATVIVLTAGYPRATPAGYRAFLSADGLQRVIAGVEAWRHTGGKLLFSGAPTPDFTDSMAHEMGRTATAFGVPAGAILLEARSGNTYENLLFSRQVLRDSGRLGGPLVLVASAFGMPRAVAVARKLDLPVLPYPCDFRAKPQSSWQDWFPSNDAAADIESVLHELIGLVVYRLRGWG